MKKLFYNFTLTICILASFFISSFATTYTFSGTGDWTDVGNWSPSYPGTSISSAVVLASGANVTISSGTTVSISPTSVLVVDYFIDIQSGASLTVEGGLDATGILAVNAGLNVNGSLVAGSATTFGDFHYQGSGSITRSSLNARSIIPGNSPGIISFSGSVALSGSYICELNGDDPGTGYDQISVGGSFSHGSLTVAFGYTPLNNQAFTLVDAASYSGSLSSLTVSPGSLTVDYDRNTGTLTILDGGLPVEWLGFRGIAEQGYVQLEWETASETNNMGFEVERSLDTEDWEKISFLEGKGESNSISTYRFQDRNPVIGRNYYRIKQLDFDGKFSFSSLIEVNYNLSPSQEIKLFPNPAQDILSIEDANLHPQNIKIFNLSGQEVNDRVNIRRTTASKIEVYVEKLPRGMYILQAENQFSRFMRL